MGNRHLMHVKLDFVEALENKKEVLILESNLLKMLQIIKKYHGLRMLELQNKRKIDLQFKKLNVNFSKMKRMIPKVEIPKRFKKEEEQIIEKPEKQEKINKKSDIELQLQDIQERLKLINQKF